jgi:DNA transposition AAA+ family ATPase
MYGDTVRTFSQIGNVRRFKVGYAALEDRGAPEATLMLVSGEPGLGKSSTAQWFAAQQGLQYVVVKKKPTPGYVMNDILRSMGVEAPFSSEAKFNLIIRQMAKLQKGLVVDEVENGLLDGAAVIDQLRIIGDATELPIVMVGREYVASKLAKYNHIEQRITSAVPFKPLVAADFRTLLDDFKIQADADVPDALVKATKGSVRLGLNELKRLRNWTKINKGKPVNADLVGKVAN